jgi:hypothetical protein
MPTIPRIAGAAYTQQISPLVLAGTGYLDNTELGFSTAANGITVGARVDSNPIMVAGFNGFMVIANLSGNYDITVSHCDPTTSAILTTHSLRVAVPGAAVLPTTFGAFSVGNVVNTVGMVWWVWRIGLQGNGADRTLTDIRVWCGTR